MRTLLFLTFIFAVKAHAASYPIREIDRPYVIASDQNEFRLGARLLSSANGLNHTTEMNPWPELAYEAGHSDSFSWVILGFKYQPLFNDTHRIGLKAYYTVFAYGLSFNYRIKLFRDTAIELEGNIDDLDLLIFRTSSRELVLRSIFQLGDNVAFIPYGSFGRYGYGSDFFDLFTAAFSKDPFERNMLYANGISGAADFQFTVSQNLDLKAGVGAVRYFQGAGAATTSVIANLQMKIRF